MSSSSRRDRFPGSTSLGARERPYVPPLPRPAGGTLTHEQRTKIVVDRAIAKLPAHLARQLAATAAVLVPALALMAAVGWTPPGWLATAVVGVGIVLAGFDVVRLADVVNTIATSSDRAELERAGDKLAQVVARVGVTAVAGGISRAAGRARLPRTGGRGRPNAPPRVAPPRAPAQLPVSNNARPITSAALSDLGRRARATGTGDPGVVDDLLAGFHRAPARGRFAFFDGSGRLTTVAYVTESQGVQTVNAVSAANVPPLRGLIRTLLGRGKPVKIVPANASLARAYERGLQAMRLRYTKRSERILSPDFSEAYRVDTFVVTPQAVH